MKKLIKIILKIAALCVGIVLVGLVTLRLMFPPEKIKQMALDYAKNNLHREIKFDSVSFNLIGVTLTNFAMSEAETFENGTFVKADRLEAKAALLPLFKKKVQISAFVIDGLDVNIQKNKDGSFNFDSFTSSADTQESPAAAEQSTAQNDATFMLTAREVTLSSADFYYSDLQTGLKTSLQDLNIRLENVDLNKPFACNISFISQTKDESGPAVSVPVNILLNVFLANLDMPRAYVDIASATAAYKHVKLALQGKVENLLSPQVNLTGTLSGLDNKAFVDFLPDLPGFTLPDIHMDLQAAADLDKSTAQLKEVSLQVLDSFLKANGNFAWGESKPTYHLASKLRANLAQLVNMTDEVKFAPKGDVSGSFVLTDKKDGKDVSGSLALKDISVLYPPFTLSQTNGTIKITSLDDISCASLTGLLNEEKFVSSFAYKNIQDVLDLTLKLNLDKLTLTQLPSFDAEDSSNKPSAGKGSSALEGESQTYMNLNADMTIGPVDIPHFRTEGVTLQAALKNMSENMQKAGGTVSFAFKPGAITDLDEFVNQSKTAKIILLPLRLLNAVGTKLKLHLFEEENQARKGEITMTKAEGHYTFVNGLMTIDNTFFESSLTNILASGTVNFVNNALDMKASATLLTKQTPMVIKITGTTDNPSGKVDVLNTVTSVVGGILSYKTAKSAVTGTASAAGGAAKTTEHAAKATVKGTADVAKAAAKALGSMFKKDKPATEAEPSTQE